MSRDINGKPLGGVLVEVFDKPDWIRRGLPASDTEQKRVAACRTGRNGKFCFKRLPPGKYALRLGKGKAWNVMHIYVEVDPSQQRSTGEGIRAIMSFGL